MSSLGLVDLNASTMVRFETHEAQPHLPYHVDFQVHVECLNNTIKCIFVDEGTATPVMSLTCWEGLGSLVLSKSMNMLTAFDGRSF